MGEEEFWKCTPKKLFALWETHMQVNGLKTEKDEVAFIDELNI